MGAHRPHAVRFDNTDVSFPVSSFQMGRSRALTIDPTVQPLDNTMFGLASPAGPGDRTIDGEAFAFGQLFGFEAASGELDLNNNRGEIDPFWPMLHSWTAIGTNNDGFNSGD